MRNIFYLLIFTTFLVNCQDKKLTSKFDLRSLKATINLPDTYINIEPDNFKNYVFSDRDSLYRKELFNNIINIPHDYFLIDTLNYNRFILIAEINPYTKIDSSLFWFIIDQERKNSCSKPTIDSTYFIGSRMGIVGDFKYLESKFYRLVTLNRKRYNYNFVISSDEKSLGISFFSPEDQDVRPFINSIKKN